MVAQQHLELLPKRLALLIWHTVESDRLEAIKEIFSLPKSEILTAVDRIEVMARMFESTNL